MYNCGNGKGRENYRHFEFYDIHQSRGKYTFQITIDEKKKIYSKRQTFIEHSTPFPDEVKRRNSFTQMIQVFK